MRRRAVWLFTLVLASFTSASAHAVIVERIVAVIGDRPILWSDVRIRAKDQLLQLESASQDPHLRAAEEQEIMRTTLERMVEDRLFEIGAERYGVTVSAADIDRTIEDIAKENNRTVPALLTEVRRAGKTEQEYRDEIRRQSIEGQITAGQFRRRVNVNEQDILTTYNRYKYEFTSAGDSIELRPLALYIAPGTTQDKLAERKKYAESLQSRAQAGEDFCDLVKRYSDDPHSRKTCATRVVPLRELSPSLKARLPNMKPGDVSEIVQIPVPGGMALLFFQVVGPGKVPPLEQVRDEIAQRALVEGLQRQRKLWLDDVRRGVVVETRL